ESVRGIADEILISDEGSCDGTVELAKDYGAVVYDDCDTHLGRRKGRLLGKSTSPWVFILDSDERVSKELAKEILLLKKSKQLPYHGYRLPYQNHVFGSPVFYGGEAYGKVRLFCKKYGKISQNPIHEEIYVQGKIGSCTGKILHHSYRNPWQLFVKFTKYAWIASKTIMSKEKEKSLDSHFRGNDNLLKKLILYGPHMFWSRFVKDQGYKDGFLGFVLALAFGYMEALQYWIYAGILYGKDIAILLCLATFHLVVLYGTPFINWPEMLVYPWFVLRQGMKMYTETIISYPPGSILAMGALFEVFGYTLSSYRFIAYLFILLIDAILYIIARKITGKRSMGAAAVLLFTLCTVFFEGNTVWFETIMTPLYLVSFYSMFRFLDTKKSKYLYHAVVLSSLSFLVKQTGVLSFGAILGVLLLTIRRNTIIRTVRYMAASFGVFLTFPFITFLYFVLTQRGREFFYWVFGMVLQFGKAGNQYALWPSRADIFYASPLLWMFFLTLLVTILLWKKYRWVRLLLLFTLVSIVGAFPRFGFHRLVPGFAFLCLGVLCGYDSFKKRYGLVVLSAVSMLLGLFVLLTPKYLHRSISLPQFFTLKEYELARFIDVHTKGEPFAIFGDYDYLYFLLNKRPYVLPWAQLFPAPASTPGLQAKLIASLKSQNVRYVFVVPYHPDQIFFSGVRPEELLGYVEKEYSVGGYLPLKGTLYVKK
ncbi:glycosyltransferase family 39 protein, partial [Candidatus Gottesmanbacteria bacterium]|nr:glycosyltransferase family 39 protein [Candidatus Gottesmanbacteria bacterium]